MLPDLLAGPDRMPARMRIETPEQFLNARDHVRTGCPHECGLRLQQRVRLSRDAVRTGCPHACGLRHQPAVAMAVEARCPDRMPARMRIETLDPSLDSLKAGPDRMPALMRIETLVSVRLAMNVVRTGCPHECGLRLMPGTAKQWIGSGPDARTNAD